MTWRDFFDEDWTIDVSEAMLPHDERPDRVTLRAADARFGAEAVTVTNRDLEGLFWGDGAQKAGTTQFSLRGKTEGELVAHMRDQLEGQIQPAIERLVRDADPSAADAIEAAWVRATARNGEDYDCGLIDYDERCRRDGRAMDDRTAGYCNLAKAILSQD